MSDHERWQAFCRGCFKVFEADTKENAILEALEHEKSCAKYIAQKAEAKK